MFKNLYMPSYGSLNPLFVEDFIGAGNAAIPLAGSPAAGCPWVKKLVGSGSPVVQPVADVPNGIIELALTATNEKQEATLYFGNALTFDMTAQAMFQCIAACTVLPSAAGVQAVLGFAGAWADGPDNNPFYLEWGFTSTGMFCRSQDGITQNAVAPVAVSGPQWLPHNSPSLAADTNFHQFTIQSYDGTNSIKFACDGDWGAILSFLAQGSNAVLQPYFSVYKPFGTGVATLQIDMARAWDNR